MSEEAGDKSRVMVFLLWCLLWISSGESTIESNPSSSVGYSATVLKKLREILGKQLFFFPFASLHRDIFFFLLDYNCITVTLK